MKKLVSYLVKKIAETNSQFTELELKKMNYGFVCLFDEITKIIPYYIIFYLFSLQQYYIVIFVFFCPIRLFSGGFHAKTYWGCFFISFVTFCVMIIIGKYITINILTSIVVLIISILLVYIFSPVDNINKRIKSKERRNKLKYLSVVITSLLSGLSYIIPNKFFTTAVLAIFIAVMMMMMGCLNNNKDKNCSSDN
ncbi:accessory gene regulator B family protein [Clostridium estertheticum]|uniref:accessory gene regulator ArgB-like protein n=1 Tax=Clostridium estertheticum TaxID=238834 RepID=UPI001C0AB1D2|nr:accessory gene regulator B family protein [Clostridium estertheticum]MBU3179457.1 accessory gene regulator B family protein [Clostridium estertheticum]